MGHGSIDGSPEAKEGRTDLDRKEVQRLVEEEKISQSGTPHRLPWTNEGSLAWTHRG